MSPQHHHSSDYPGYLEEYERWVASLSPEEREELKHLGVDRPDLPSDRANVRDKGLADSPLASVEPDIAAQIDPSISAEPASGEERSDILASFCAHIRSAKNPLLALDAICFATGIHALDGKSATEIAAWHGITKQAFSKTVVQWCDTFGLNPSRAMKSLKARKSYAQRAKAFHERRRLTRRREA